MSSELIKECNSLEKFVHWDQGYTHLRFINKGFGVDDAKSIAFGLKRKSCNVSHINLSMNEIGDKGALALASVLKVNKTVTCLNLTDCAIKDMVAEALFKALEANTSIKEINLSYNSITSGGIKALANMLKANNTITKIHLAGNNIGDEGAKLLAEAVNDNTSLSTLGLEECNIGNDGASALLNILDKTAIEELLLESNDIDDNILRNILEELELTEVVKEEVAAEIASGEDVFSIPHPASPNPNGFTGLDACLHPKLSKCDTFPVLGDQQVPVLDSDAI